MQSIQQDRKDLSPGQLEVVNKNTKKSCDNLTRREGDVVAADVAETFSSLCSNAPFIMVMDYFKFKVHFTDKEK